LIEGRGHNKKIGRVEGASLKEMDSKKRVNPSSLSKGTEKKKDVG